MNKDAWPCPSSYARFPIGSALVTKSRPSDPQLESQVICVVYREVELPHLPN